MHINRKPGEQVEVDWAGDPAHIMDPDTGEVIDAYLFVGVMTYSQYTYVEAFINEKQQAWITAHIHMFEFFGGVAKILVPDNCKTAVVHNGGWYSQQVNTIYHGVDDVSIHAPVKERLSAFPKNPTAPMMVSFSGGKDSTVTSHIVRTALGSNDVLHDEKTPFYFYKIKQLIF